MIQYRQLRYFLAVAEEMNFRKAAHVLNMSQPPLSQAIKQLEDEIGTPLFVRSGRSIALTAAGQMLYKRAPFLLEATNDVVSHVRNIGHGQRGKLDIGYNSAIMLTALADTLKEFRVLYPDIAVQLKQMPSNQQILAVEAGEIDIGFVDVALLTLKKQGMLRYKLAYHFRLLAALPKNHSLSGQQKINCGRLADDKHIILERHQFPSLHDKILSVCNEAGFSPSIEIFAEQLPTCLGLIAAGYGVGLAPDCAAPGWSHSVHFAELEKEDFIDVYSIWRDDSENRSIDKLLSMISLQQNIDT